MEPVTTTGTVRSLWACRRRRPHGVGCLLQARPRNSLGAAAGRPSAGRADSAQERRRTRPELGRADHAERAAASPRPRPAPRRPAPETTPAPPRSCRSSPPGSAAPRPTSRRSRRRRPGPPAPAGSRAASRAHRRRRPASPARRPPTAPRRRRPRSAGRRRSRARTRAGGAASADRERAVEGSSSPPGPTRTPAATSQARRRRRAIDGYRDQQAQGGGHDRREAGEVVGRAVGDRQPAAHQPGSRCPCRRASATRRRYSSRLSTAPPLPSSPPPLPLRTSVFPAPPCRHGRPSPFP